MGFMPPKGGFTTGLELWQPQYSQERSRHFQGACGKLVKIIKLVFLHGGLDS